MHKQVIINLPIHAPDLKFNFGDRVAYNKGSQSKDWFEGVILGLNLINDGKTEWQYLVKFDSGLQDWCEEEKLHLSSTIPQLQEEWMKQYEKDLENAYTEDLGLGDW